MNINYQTDHGILSVEPTGPMGQGDFRDLATAIDNARQQQKGLRGILIRARDFPGYERPSDMMKHAELVKEQGKKVGKVAVTTDSSVGKMATLLGQLFVDAEVKRFDYSEQDDAEKWLLA